MEGWIKLHRQLLNWEWYSDKNVCRLFIHLLLKANYTDNEWKGTIIKRGQLITSAKHLSEETNLTESQIRTALDKLKMTNEITIKTTNKFSVITIEKYSDYQYQEEKNSKQNDKQDDNQITTNKEYNNNKNNIIYFSYNKENDFEEFTEGDEFDKYIKTKGIKTKNDFYKLDNNKQEKLREDYIMMR